MLPAVRVVLSAVRRGNCGLCRGVDGVRFVLVNVPKRVKSVLTRGIPSFAAAAQWVEANLSGHGPEMGIKVGAVRWLCALAVPRADM